MKMAVITVTRLEYVELDERSASDYARAAFDKVENLHLLDDDDDKVAVCPADALTVFHKAWIPEEAT